MSEYLANRGPYLLFVLLIAVGTYILVAHRHYLKTLAGLYLFQSGIILFFILLSVRRDGTVPILGERTDHGSPMPPLDNPLPHALMLTAIVVGVATLGVALAILRRMQAEDQSIEQQGEGGG
jgi:multicomponent Na+:H+ antiporter subunit C